MSGVTPGTVMPPMPPATTPVTAAATTPAVNSAIAAAKDLPDLVQKLQTASPQLAQQIEGMPLIYSKTPVGTLAVAAVTWAAAKWGLGWDATTCDLVAGAGLLIGSYFMRWLTTSPISGWFSKGTVTPPVIAPPPPPPAASSA